ncbi:MAG: RagB/SusD family nutrient uptake outer membrane protein, partial [Hymenobacter sp.]
AQNVNIARTPAADVYVQIIKDMTAAEAVLKNNTDWGNTGRISKTAAAGILARVCLHAAGRLGDQPKYAEARTWALKVMNSGLHALNSDYSQIFKNESADIYDLKECLWEVEFNGNGVGNVFREIERFGSTIGIPNTNETAGFMQGQYVATGVQYQRYGTGDLRRDWNIAPFTYTGQDATKAQIPYAATYVWGRYVAKWRRQYQTIAFAKNFGPTNWPLLRYSDVLLMFAEADNEVNGGPTTAGYLALNQVRRRGYGLPIGAASAVADTRAGQSKADFLTTLKDERARELAFEGHRKLDLLRWGTFLTVMKGMVPIITTQAPNAANSGIGYYGRAATLVPYNNVAQRDLLWPIPSTEVSLNKSITQNPGW